MAPHPAPIKGIPHNSKSIQHFADGGSVKKAGDRPLADYREITHTPGGRVRATRGSGDVEDYPSVDSFTNTPDDEMPREITRDPKTGRKTTRY